MTLRPSSLGTAILLLAAAALCSGPSGASPKDSKSYLRALDRVGKVMPAVIQGGEAAAELTAFAAGGEPWTPAHRQRLEQAERTLAEAAPFADDPDVAGMLLVPDEGGSLSSYVSRLRARLSALLSIAWSQGGEPEKARAAARKAVELDPEDGLARQELARASLLLGDYPSAKKNSLESSRLSPRLPDAKAVLAGAKYYLGDYPGAEKAALEAVSLDGGNVLARATLEAARAKLSSVPAEDPPVELAARGHRIAGSAAKAPAAPVRRPALGAGGVDPEALAGVPGAEPLLRALHAEDYPKALSLGAELSRSLARNGALSLLRSHALLKLGRLDEALREAGEAADAGLAAEGDLQRARIHNAARAFPKALESAEAALDAGLGAGYGPGLGALALIEKAKALEGLGRESESMAAYARAASSEKGFEKDLVAAQFRSEGAGSNRGPWAKALTAAVLLLVLGGLAFLALSRPSEYPGL